MKVTVFDEMIVTSDSRTVQVLTMMLTMLTTLIFFYYFLGFQELAATQDSIDSVEPDENQTIVSGGDATLTCTIDVSPTTTVSSVCTNLICSLTLGTSITYCYCMHLDLLEVTPISKKTMVFSRTSKQ